MQRACVLFAALHQAENHCCDASSTACLGCFDVRNARHAIVCLTRIACAQGWQLSCFRLVCTTLPTQPGAADPTLWCGSALHVCWLAALACTVAQFVQLRLWHPYLCVHMCAFLLERAVCSAPLLHGMATSSKLRVSLWKRCGHHCQSEHRRSTASSCQVDVRGSFGGVT